MAYPIDKKLVMAVASSALFDLSDSDKVYRDRGVDAYRKYQREKENTRLRPGVAFPLIRRLLRLNEGVAETDAPVEVVLLSRNDPDTGLRVLNPIEKHGLPMSRAIFVSGRNPFRYMNALNASLFLSADATDVRKAVEVATSINQGDLPMSTGVLAAIFAVVAGALFVAVFRSKGKPKQ